nr:hypothetical protein CFP56_69281 [Quercus suber]
MEEDLIEELKHMKLTKEEEVQIAVSREGRRELTEECELSLVGRLLSNRKQNQRALKSTLRSAWKTGSDLRIVEEKIGRDIGNSIGNFMAADSKSWSSDQAKFMRIRVNIPLNRPLRRCGVVVNPEGEKFKVYFRYERLPVFCFLCGVMGHDERHCTSSERRTEELPQYGDWLRAQGGSKIGSQRKDQVKTTVMQKIIQNPAEMGQDEPPEKAGKGEQDAERRCLETSGNSEKQKVSRKSASMSDSDSILSNSLFQIQFQNSQNREIEAERAGLEKAKVGKVLSGPYESSDQEQSMGSNFWEPSLGLEQMKTIETEEVNSPIKAQKDPIGEQSDKKEIEIAQSRKGRWKKLARGQTTNNGIVMECNDSTVGKKRSLWAEEEDEEGMQKRARAGPAKAQQKRGKEGFLVNAFAVPILLINSLLLGRNKTTKNKFIVFPIGL